MTRSKTSTRTVNKTHSTTVSNHTNSTEEVVFRGIKRLVNAHHSWVGSMTSLTAALSDVRVLSKQQQSLLPGSPSALRVAVNRVANRLRNRGVSVRFGRMSARPSTKFVRFAR